MRDAIEFAVVFATFFVAHQVGDHWIQTTPQAHAKGRAGWQGRVACAKHVATYTVTMLLMLFMAVAALGLTLSWWGVAAGQVVSVVTHYIADRRTPLKAMAAWFDNLAFYTLGVPREGRDDNPSLGTGAYAMDQSWHYFWLWIAAGVTVVVEV